MKKTTFLTLCASLISLPLANAASVVIGDDSDLSPAAAADLDGATPMIIVDYQANLYTNTSGSAQTLTPSNFTFFADSRSAGIGQVRPFVALLTGAGTAVGDYDVLAIGATRVEGTDYAPGGIISIAFGGAPSSISVPAGGILVGGIEQGMGGAGTNVVPFGSNSGLNTFITGGGPAGTLDVATDITAGGSTWSSLNGGRNYEYTITLVPEPSALTLLPAALGFFLIVRRRRK